MTTRLRYLTDEDFNNDVMRGLMRRVPGLDLVGVQDVGLATALDPIVLDWAAAEGRILLTHDAKTMQDAAYARVAVGLPMPGTFVVRQTAPISRVIQDLVVLTECSRDGEWENIVLRVPL